MGAMHAVVRGLALANGFAVHGYSSLACHPLRPSSSHSRTGPGRCSAVSRPAMTDCAALASSPVMNQASRNKRSLSCRKHAKISVPDARLALRMLLLAKQYQNIFRASRVGAVPERTHSFRHGWGTELWLGLPAKPPFNLSLLCGGKSLATCVARYLIDRRRGLGVPRS
jgi:hypothetical protein